MISRDALSSDSGGKFELVSHFLDSAFSLAHLIHVFTKCLS
jgi:hypothetical protein